VLVHLNKTSL